LQGNKEKNCLRSPLYIFGSSFNAIMLVCERDKTNMAFLKINEFLKKIFSKDKDYQMSKGSIEKQYKKISEKHKRRYCRVKSN